MALTSGPNLGLLVNGNQGELHYNELMKMWRGLDGLIQASVISAAIATPPGSPVDGDCYVVAAAPTGVWVGHANHIARYSGVATAWEFYTPKAGWTVWNVAAGVFYEFTSVWAARGTAGSPVAIPIAVSDETTALTTGTAKVTFRMPHPMTLTAVRASLTTAQTSGAIFTVDINESGASVISTKLTIDNTEKTSTTAAAAAVISDAALADDAEITIDIDQIGDGTAKGLKVYLIGTR